MYPPIINILQREIKYPDFYIDEDVLNNHYNICPVCSGPKLLDEQVCGEACKMKKKSKE